MLGLALGIVFRAAGRRGGWHLFPPPPQAVAVLRRDPASGGLELVELVPESIRGVLGSMTLSPDGRHLYLGDLDGDRHRLTTFVRDAGSGRLEPGGEFAGRPARLGDQVTMLHVDPSGQELYASGFENRPLPRLERDPVTGALGYQPPVHDAAETVSASWDLAVSPGGDQLYAVGGGSVASFAWDDAAATLEPRVALAAVDQGMAGLLGQIQMRMSGDGSRLHLFTEWGHLISLAPGEAGDLELVGDFEPTYAFSDPDLEVSPDGNHLYLFGGGFHLGLKPQATQCGPFGARISV